MKGMRKIIVALLAVLVLLVAALMGLMIVNNRNFIIDGKAYPKDADYLDLRGEEITLQHYETVRQVFPDAEILWDVPLAGGAVSCDSREVAAADLAEFAAWMDHFTALETLDVSGCGDLSLLPTICEKQPGLKLKFALTVDGNTYTQDSREVTLSDVGETELVLLRAMTGLERVTVQEGGETVGIPALAEFCAENNIGTRAILNGKAVEEELSLENATEDQVTLLMLASGLETLHLAEPQAEAQTLLTLRSRLTDTAVTWEKRVMGLTFSSDAAEIDLTSVIAREEGEPEDQKTAYEYALDCEVMGKREENPSSGRIQNNHPIPDKFDQTEQFLTELEAAMAYFPEAEKLVLCGAWLDNDAMAAYREEHRAEYKTVWTVRCGPLITRTDAAFFMPTKYHVPYTGFTELDIFNLRYCEDVECIDIGHFAITNLDFVEFMPNLRYLDLTFTNVKELDPLATCKNLVFLDMHITVRVEDYSPLLECTALRDLNIGTTAGGINGDISAILEMTWLENLWVVGGSREIYQQVMEALPDTNIGYYYGNPDDGWRSLPNYFKMRDTMLMFYLT